MLKRILVVFIVSLLMAVPSIAQENKSGRYTAVTFGDDGTKWTMELNLDGDTVSAEFSYENCSSCDFERGNYICLPKIIKSVERIALQCRSDIRGFISQRVADAIYVEIFGNLNRISLDVGFYGKVDFALLNERNFSDYQLFATANKISGTDKYVSPRQLMQSIRAKSPPQDKVVSSDQRSQEIAPAEPRRLLATAHGFQEGLAAAKRGDYATALREWRPIAEQGRVEAQFSLAQMYHQGRGVPQDYAEAVKWYHKAAERGLAEAQANLGILYAKGRGVPQDYVYAYMWLSLSAAKGDKDGTKARDLVAKLMPPAQIAEAQKLTREWWVKQNKK